MSKELNSNPPLLRVRAKPCIELEAQHGWELVLWLGDAFDYSTPFRHALSSIESVLSQSVEVSLSLPAYQPNEDFVEGALEVGSQVIRVYYEYSLGYLSLTSNDRSVLDQVAARILPWVRVSGADRPL